MSVIDEVRWPRSVLLRFLRRGFEIFLGSIGEMLFLDKTSSKISLVAKLDTMSHIRDKRAYERVYLEISRMLVDAPRCAQPNSLPGKLVNTISLRGKRRKAFRTFRKCTQPRFVLTSSNERRINSAMLMPSFSDCFSSHSIWGLVKTTDRWIMGFVFTVKLLLCNTRVYTSSVGVNR